MNHSLLIHEVELRAHVRSAKHIMHKLGEISESFGELACRRYRSETRVGCMEKCQVRLLTPQERPMTVTHKQFS